MTLGLVGRKRGMSRIYTDDGRAVAVTVIEVEPNRVVRLKNEATDGYTAVEVVVGAVRPERLAKPQVGHFAKAGVEPGPVLLEWRVAPDELERYPVGSTIPLTHLPVGRTVDVRGRTRGKGFAGTIKRHHFASQDATHGNSLSHRVPGAIGQRQTPGRVFKGKRMAGRLGHVERTQLNLRLERIDEERGLLFVAGAVPGAPGTLLRIRPAIRRAAGEEASS
jgi:large subunit ribosomal protein L3